MTEDQQLAALGNAIRQLREERSLSPDALANAAGVDPAQLTSVEAGQLDADFDFLLSIAAGLSTAGSRDPVSVATIVTRAEGQAT